MGIRFNCPSGHKIHVKSFLAGKRGICPTCGVKVDIPFESTRGKKLETGRAAAPVAARAAAQMNDLPGNYATAGAATATLPAPSTVSQVAAYSVMPTATAAAPVAAARPLAVGASAGSATMNAAPLTASPLAVAPAPPAPATPFDPIAEAPNAVWYVRPPSGGQYGPAAGDVLRRWIEEGRVTGDSYVWREGWPDWKGASEIFAKFQTNAAPQLAAAPGVAAMGIGAPAATGFALAANAPAASSAATSSSIRPRRKKNPMFALIFITVMVMASLGLLGLLVVLLAGN